MYFSYGADTLLSFFSGCSRVEPLWYRAISDEEFVLQCALPDGYASHSYNISLPKQHKVKWFWSQKDKEPLKAIMESSNPVLQADALLFKPIKDRASGVYVCMIWYVAEQKAYISIQELF